MSKQNDKLSDKIVRIYDNGLFVEMAMKLSKSFKRVEYFVPWKNAFPKSNLTLVGEGISGLVRIQDFWEDIDSVDLFCFFDCYDGDIQLHLQDLGKRVWGGRKGDDMELDRWACKERFKEIGINVQPIKKIVGISALRDHLKKVENKYIKVSKFRGDFETFHHTKYYLSEPKLDELEYNLGAKKFVEEFIVEDALDGAIESGYDGYCIDGKFPSKGIQGYEIKDCGYGAMFTEYKNLAPVITDVNKKMAPDLEEYGYRGFISSEIRIMPNGKGYPIDPCTRCGSPPNELYQEMFANLAEIIWYGADGILVDPIPIAKYGIEVMLHSSWADKNWQTIFCPDKIRQWLKLRNLTVIDKKLYIVPNEIGLPEIGAVVAIGNSFDECIKKVKGYCEQIEGYYLDFKLDSIEKMEENIKQGAKFGIKFS